jgi:hypothetical protein
MNSKEVPQYNINPQLEQNEAPAASEQKKKRKKQKTEAQKLRNKASVGISKDREKSEIQKLISTHLGKLKPEEKDRFLHLNNKKTPKSRKELYELFAKMGIEIDESLEQQEYSGDEKAISRSQKNKIHVKNHRARVRSIKRALINADQRLTPGEKETYLRLKNKVGRGALTKKEKKRLHQIKVKLELVPSLQESKPGLSQEGLEKSSMPDEHETGHGSSNVEQSYVFKQQDGSTYGNALQIFPEEKYPEQGMSTTEDYLDPSFNYSSGEQLDYGWQPEYAGSQLEQGMSTTEDYLDPSFNYSSGEQLDYGWQPEYAGSQLWQESTQQVVTDVQIFKSRQFEDLQEDVRPTEQGLSGLIDPSLLNYSA